MVLPVVPPGKAGDSAGQSLVLFLRTVGWPFSFHEPNGFRMVLLGLVPLLPLLTAFIVMTGHRADQESDCEGRPVPYRRRLRWGARHSGARALRGGYHGTIL